MTPERNLTLSFPGGRSFCLRDEDLRDIDIDPDAITDDEFELIKRELQTILVGKFRKFVKKAAKRALVGKYCPFEIEGDE